MINMDEYPVSEELLNSKLSFIYSDNQDLNMKVQLNLFGIMIVVVQLMNFENRNFQITHSFYKNKQSLKYFELQL